MTLTAKNYKSGFLVDDELMGAISDGPEGYASYVIRHTTGEYLGYKVFSTLDEAIGSLTQIERDWKFESTKSCGDGGGECKGNCGAKH